MVQVSATTQAALQTTLANHGASSVVILNGVITGVTATTAVGGGQTLLGGGAVLALRGASTGTAVNFLARGRHLTGAVANNGFVALSSATRESAMLR